MPELVDILAQSAKPAKFALRQGVVSSPLTGPPKTVTLTLAGGTVGIDGVRYLSSYTATDGDTVWALINGTDIIVLGDLA